QMRKRVDDAHISAGLHRRSRFVVFLDDPEKVIPRSGRSGAKLRPALALNARSQYDRFQNSPDDAGHGYLTFSTRHSDEELKFLAIRPADDPCPRGAFHAQDGLRAGSHGLRGNLAWPLRGHISR